MELREALLRSSTMPRARSCVAPCLQALKRESCPGGAVGAGGLQLCRKGIYSSQLTHLGPPNVGHKERAGGFYIAPLPPSTDSSRAAFSFW